jgi:hypothetical protein
MEAPNTKHQTPEKLQAPSSKLEARAAVWSFGTWVFFGVWSLVFGVSIPAFFRHSSFGFQSALVPADLAVPRNFS